MTPYKLFVNKSDVKDKRERGEPKLKKTMNKLLACMLVVTLGLSSYPVYATGTTDESNEQVEDTDAKISYQLPADDIVVANVEPNDDLEPQAEVEPEDDVVPPADDSTTINLADDNISSNVPTLDDFASDESQLVIPQGEDEHDITPYSSNTVTIVQSQTIGEIQTAIQVAIDSASSGETVIVLGEKLYAQESIIFDVPGGKTVDWQAEVRSVSIIHAALHKTGHGHMIISDGTIITNHNHGMRFEGRLTMRGGRIEAGNSAIVGLTDAEQFDMMGGTLTSVDNPAVSMPNANCHIHIRGGTIYSVARAAINMGHQHSSLTISGGLITSDGWEHTVMMTHGAPTNDVIVSGTGRVEARVSNNAIETAGGVSVTDSAVVTANAGRGMVVGGDVTISDSAVVSSVSGIAIRAGQPTSNVTVSGGTVSSGSHNAIYVSGNYATVAVSGGLVYSEGAAHTIENNHGVGSSDNVTISGTGRVEARGSGNAIHTFGNVSVSDSAFVSASTTTAINALSTASTVTVDGGVVFSPGSAVFGVDSVILMNGGTPTISDPAVVVAWNKAAGNIAYVASTTRDLVSEPSGATVGWDSSGGIAYANGVNTGIIPINGITVTKITLTESDLIYTDPATLNHAYTGVAQGIGTVTLKPPHDVLFNATTGGTIAVYYDSETTVPTNAGTYAVEVRISGGPGYEAVAIPLGNYTIAKAAAPSITYPVATTITYGETLASAALTGGSITHGDFAWDDGSIYPTVVNSGYTVNFTPNPHTLANYEPITTLSETVAITVNKATTSGVPQTLEVVNTQAHTYSYDLTALLPDVSPRTLGTVTYNVTSVDNTDGVLATEPTNAVVSPLTLDVANVADIGKTAKITITISSDNYNDFTAVLTVETVPKQTVTITADMAGGIYNGMPYAYSNPVVTSDLDDSILSGITLDVLYESSDGGTYSNTLAPTSTGDYKLTLSVPSDNLEYTGSEIFDFTIAPKELTITSLVIADKTYDGNTIANISGTPSLDGIVGSDAVNLTNGTPTFVSKNAGDDIAINLTAFSLAGIDAHNYTLIQPTGITANIHKANLTWGSNGTVHDKTYDGTTNATVDTLPELSGVIGSEDVTPLSGTVTFSSAAVGSHAITISGWGITGTDIGNYNTPIGNPTFTNGTISKASLTWDTSGTVHDKTYDGTTNATVDTLPGLSGVIGSEDVTPLGGTVTFSSADVGLHPMITSGWGITGTDIGNYHTPIGNPTFTNGTIIPAEPTSFAIDIQNDGNGTASADIILATVGTHITLTATPNSGYAFKEWQVLSGGVTVTDNQFIMPAGAVTIKAIFEEIAPLPTPSEYTITSGANQSWRKGTIAGVTITSAGDFADFIGIKVDGVLVDTTNYTATAGSTITTLKAAYLEMLALGAHTVELVFAEGTVQTELTILNAASVDTGDKDTDTNNQGDDRTKNANGDTNNTNNSNNSNNTSRVNTGSKLNSGIRAGKSPQLIRGVHTGDSSNLMLYGGLLTLASAIIVVLKKRKKQSFK